MHCVTIPNHHRACLRESLATVARRCGFTHLPPNDQHRAIGQLTEQRRAEVMRRLEAIPMQIRKPVTETREANE
ncbi:hypothetical protein Poly24_06540 [Rosistilla carotiformis]|uniref:Uncharacterized protein n=1 Tax=Rosistilla carotiformis TaxID=2528017 RepID=A0A518JN29_9BACT|nr:hypothetical protein Poly24_06540 [Rosistilla carotiformis]